MNTEPSTIVAKLTIDTTEYDKVLERVKADLASLGAALGSGVKVEAVKENGAKPDRPAIRQALYLLGVDTDHLVSVRLNFGAGSGAGGELETVHREIGRDVTRHEYLRRDAE